MSVKFDIFFRVS